MVRSWVKLLLVDLVVLVAAYAVVSDLYARLNCATGQDLYGQGCLARSSPQYSYSLLTRYFSMVSGGATLQSPPYLDWLQLLAVIFIVVNVWYLLARAKQVRRPTAGKMTD
jgi:hypothetical protein